MPKLKCIGGMADGQWAKVHDNFITHDQVMVSAKITFNISSFDEDLKAFKEGRTPEHFSIPYYMYRICVLKYKDLNGPVENQYYLIPHNWHEWEAIKHMFSCYHAT